MQPAGNGRFDSTHWSLILAVGVAAFLIDYSGYIGMALVAVFAATRWGGGFWLRAFGIAVVTRDGRAASPIRAGLRAAAVWSWVPAQALADFFVIGPILGALSVGKLLGIVWTNERPRRGPQDHLLGTYLVPC